MSDIRFIMIGVVVISVGFVIFGFLGEDFQTSNLETNEFGDCFDYSSEEPIPIDCSEKMQDQTIFLGIVLALIAGGIISLIKGIRGDWDNKVKPEDMVGPSRGNSNSENKKDGD